MLSKNLTDFSTAQTLISLDFNSRGGWNKRVGGAKIAKSINLEGGIFWKKLVFNCNKRVEGGKNLIYKSINVEGGCFFSKSVSLTLRLLER